MKKRANVIEISPLVDFAFKLLLGSPEHWRVTVHFLNSILGGAPRIVQVSFKNPIRGKDYDEAKVSILDIAAVDDQGRQFNIEMQTTLPAGLRQRLAFYDARLYVDQMTAGDKYHDLKPAIVICVLNKALISSQSELHSDFRLRDESGLVLTDDLQVHLLELTKLKVKRENLASASPLERWAYFFLNAPSMTREEIRELLPDPEFIEAAGILEMIKETPEKMREYAARMKLRLDEAARIEYARDEGLQEGLQKGEAKGFQKGEAKGRQVGRKEGRQEGELLGRIKFLQELLGVETPTPEELSAYELRQLSALAQRLQKKLDNRPQ